MRRWRLLVVMLMIVALLFAVPVAEAGGLLDTRGAIQALAPFVVINAVVTGLVSTLLIQGCNGG